MRCMALAARFCRDKVGATMVLTRPLLCSRQTWTFLVELHKTRIQAIAGIDAALGSCVLALSEGHVEIVYTVTSVFRSLASDGFTPSPRDATNYDGAIAAISVDRT